MTWENPRDQRGLPQTDSPPRKTASAAAQGSRDGWTERDSARLEYERSLAWAAYGEHLDGGVTLLDVHDEPVFLPLTLDLLAALDWTCGECESWVEYSYDDDRTPELHVGWRHEQGCPAYVAKATAARVPEGELIPGTIRRLGGAA